MEATNEPSVLAVTPLHLAGPVRTTGVWFPVALGALAAAVAEAGVPSESLPDADPPPPQPATVAMAATASAAASIPRRSGFLFATTRSLGD
jgi:hypothetical protein